MATPHLLERIDIANETALGGHSDVELDEGIEASLEAGGSDIYPPLHYVPGVLPMVRCNTFDLGRLLPTAYGSSRWGYIPITPTNTCDVYFQAVADGGTRGNCTRTRINKGMLVIDRIAAAGRLASAAITIYADYDGTNLPFVTTTGVSALSGNTSALSLWRLIAIKDDSTTIHKLGDWSIETGLQLARSVPLNTVYAMDSAAFRFAPTARFGTHDLAGALTLSGSGGKAAGTAGLQFILAPYSGTGVGFATTGCMQLVLRTGSIYYPLSIPLGREAPKMIQYACIGKGGSAITDIPLSYAGSISAPTESTSSGQWMQGPIKHNTTALDIAAGEFNFGQNWVAEETPANLWWPTVCYQRSEAPFVDLGHVDQAAYAALTAVSAISTGLFTYFRKLTADGQPDLDANANHIKLSINGGVLRRVRSGGNFQRSIEPRLLFQSVKGGSAMLTIATASAIT